MSPIESGGGGGGTTDGGTGGGSAGGGGGGNVITFSANLTTIITVTGAAHLYSRGEVMQ